MKELLRDFRIRRLLLANITGSIGSGVTLFAVPWLLVHQPGGDITYGSVTLLTTIVLFFFMPYYGLWVDRHSRKTMLLSSELFGALAMVGMVFVGSATGHYGSGLLATIYFCGMLYYTLHVPAKFAFLQQVFDKSQYQPLMGLMEIQGQTAMMIAAGLGAILVEHVSLTTILLIDAGTYAFSFVIQSTIPYQSTHLEAATGQVRGTAWQGVREGWRWLRNRPKLTIFFAASLMPFIALMVGHYLFPIYITQTLHAGAWVFGAGEIVFSLGAILAGLSLPRLIAVHSARRTIPLTMSIFVAGAAILVFFPSITLYLIAGLLLGYGNAGIRVARGAVMLHLIDNKVMGRVGSFFHAFDRVLRTIMTSVVIVIVASGGARPAFALLLILVLAGLAAVLRTRSALAPAPT